MVISIVREDLSRESELAPASAGCCFMKRIALALVLLAVIGAGVGFYVWKTAGGEGSSGIEQWIARIIVRVLDSHVKPQIKLGDLDYQAPYTVVIDQLELIEDDATILAVDRIRLELAEIPKVGVPIQIKDITMTRPRLLFAQSAEGGFVGWSDFIEPGVVRNPESVEPGSRLSDVLVLRHVGIDNGQIEYRTADGQRMIVPDINLNLETPPVQAAPGWYALKGRLERKPGFELDFDGQVNLDETVLDFDALTMNVDVGPEVYETIPPPLQGILRKHEVEGRMTSSLNGRCPLLAPLSTTAKAEVELVEGRIAVDDKVLPVDRLKTWIEIRNRQAFIRYNGDLLGGSILGDATTALEPPMTAVWKWEISSIRLEETLKAAQQNPDYAGIVSSQGEISANLMELPDTLSGSGRLELTEGRLARIPVISSILELVDLARLGTNLSRSDSADVEFTLHPSHLMLESFRMKSGPAVVSGSGRVDFNTTLDLDVKAGAVQRLTDKVPALGQLLSTVNDQLVSYDVTGTVAEPKVKVKPLNIRLPG